jgi:twitching motility protein PilU
MDFTTLLRLMKSKRASDLFITAGVPPSLKVDGKLTQVSKNSLTPDQAKDIIYRIMPAAQRLQFEKTHEANFALQVNEAGRFRVNVYRHQNYVGMVLRRIETEIPSFEQLCLPANMQEMAMYRNGLVLVVGATGAGKSTTLAAMIDYRNQHSNGHIVSIEDPIEFVHKPAGCIVTQREVGIDTMSYEAALKNTLRQSPDLVVIGEIRSRESMQHAIEFAETGHLCLATLHAANAHQAIERILSFYPEDRRNQILLDISLNLKAVVAQRLILKKDGGGRRVAVEQLFNTALIATHIRKYELHLIKDVMRKSEELGMKTFERALYELFRTGEISYDDALSNADSANEMRLMIKLKETHDPNSMSPNFQNVSFTQT